MDQRTKKRFFVFIRTNICCCFCGAIVRTRGVDRMISKGFESDYWVETDNYKYNNCLRRCWLFNERMFVFI